MNKILKIYPDDLQVTIQPGIIGTELDKKLKPYKLWFAAAPGSKHLATIGGMIANNAGGMHAVKYGVVGDAVLELEIVLANGDVIRVGSRSFKTVAGYDLKSLFIASEGTLGIITEATVKVTPLPDAKIALLAAFATNESAAKTSISILSSDTKPAAIEFMDASYIRLINKAKNTKLEEQPTLLIELHENKEIIGQKLMQIKNICKRLNATAIYEFTAHYELKNLWEYRRAVRPILRTLLPNTGVLSAEVGVPLSQIPPLLNKFEQAAKTYDVRTVIFGHMGDGNFHGWALYTLNDKKSWSKAVAFNEEIIKFAIDKEGTTTGEHGIGIGKRKFLSHEHGTSVQHMKKIKDLFDPNGILNPGKIFPE